MLPEFDLLRPKTVPEALAMLAGDGAMPIAGGTNVVVDLRAGKHHPAALVDVTRLAGLRGIQRVNGHLVIGGGTTITDLLHDPLIARHAPALREAAAVFANPLIRNRATVAGNLVDASPAADTAPPLLALDAEVELSSQGGVRRVPLADFLVGVRKTVRRPDELLTAVRIPVPSAAGSANHFHKLGLRKADAIVGAERRRGPDVGRRRTLRVGPHRVGRAGPAAAARTAAEEVLLGQVADPRADRRSGPPGRRSRAAHR